MLLANIIVCNMYKWIFFFGLFYVIRAEMYRVSSLGDAGKWEQQNMGDYFATGNRANGYPIFKKNNKAYLHVTEEGFWLIGEVVDVNKGSIYNQRKATTATPPVTGWMYYNYKVNRWMNDSQLTVQKLVGIMAREDFELAPGYAIGRLIEGQFEYTSLNRWMTPKKAANICEDDLMCGGFTYKGSLIMEKEYDIYFFKLIVNVEEGRDSWKWIYYKVKRQFSTFPGVFTNVENRKNKKRWRNNETITWDLVKVESAEKKCLSLAEKCVGFIETINKPDAVLMDYIDMDTFVESPNKVTKVKLVVTNNEYEIYGSSSWDNLKVCCPKSEKVNTEKLLEEIDDTVERISCDIPKKEFLEKYVKRRQVVVLVNCSTDWYAQKHWTIDNLLNEGDGKLLWSGDFRINKNISSTKANYFKKYQSTQYIPATVLQQIMEFNGTIQVFDTVGKKIHTAVRKKHGPILKSDKMYLLREYYPPKPVPSDYFEMSGIMTNYQWILFSQGDTGTELHTDPKYTDPWNTLISGHKWWTFLPPDVLPDQFLCDGRCSKGGTEDEISKYAWYTHILPQLRNRIFYGSTIRNILQKPGETLFMPGHLAHSVMNLEDTVSVTENYNMISNLVDFVHGVMVGEELLEGEYVFRVMVGEDLLDGDGMKDEEKFWKAMYNKHMDRDGRNVMRQMRRQVEHMARVNPDVCNEEKEGINEGD